MSPTTSFSAASSDLSPPRTYMSSLSISPDLSDLSDLSRPRPRPRPRSQASSSHSINTLTQNKAFGLQLWAGLAELRKLDPIQFWRAYHAQKAHSEIRFRVQVSRAFYDDLEEEYYPGSTPRSSIAGSEIFDEARVNNGPRCLRGRLGRGATRETGESAETGGSWGAEIKAAGGKLRKLQGLFAPKKRKGLKIKQKK